MIEDCLEIFKEKLAEKGERFVLDNYIPKDGTFILVEMAGEEWKIGDPVVIQYNRKSGEIEGREYTAFSDICYMDYYSKLVEMNKPMDSAKIIHTNNFLSFGVKKETLGNGKLTTEVIEGYYQTLKNPRLKYKKSKMLEIYEETELVLGEIDVELIEKIEKWTKEHIFELNLDISKKDYLKIFFCFSDNLRTKEMFKQEGERYIIPNIYNSNDFNIKINGEVYGLPNNNMGMNSKKPFLANRTRGIGQVPPLFSGKEEKEKYIERPTVPYLLSQQEVLVQAQFFDYLMAMVSQGKSNIYVDTERRVFIPCTQNENPNSGFSGYFLRLKKGKEVEIYNFDTVIGYNPNLQPAFRYKPILKIENEDVAQNINRRYQLESLIDEVYFNKSLISNYFTATEDLSVRDNVVSNRLVLTRNRLFVWFRLNHEIDILPLFNQISKTLVQNSIANGYMKKAKQQLNLKWSLQDYFSQDNKMEEIMNRVEEKIRNHMKEKDTWDFSEDDEEYYFAVGQMVYFFLTKNKGSKKALSFANPFLNAKTDEMLKKQLGRLFKKYNYDIFDYNTKVKNLYSRIMLYHPQKPVDSDMISAGMTAENVIFIKSEKEDGGKENE